ncbi:vesicle-associated membrane protein 2 isoform X1 [Drosophila willistoni]|uniref:vesicle-associated membrane protein 2 isoform X1 n=1 Tax=Drosophila willistoni TaxID=7260 RepID=UPI000C26DAE8|nr:vesicle-associated membrane protein 2 isoform X1 [Drosophila willistoni]
MADAAPAGDVPPNAGPPAGEGGDGEIVGGPHNPQQIAAQKRLQQTQAQVDEVVDIMRTNVEKVLERDSKLSELDDRADALQQGASQFEQQAGKLKRKFWLQNLKMMIIMGVIGLVIVGIIAKPYMSDDAPPPSQVVPTAHASANEIAPQQQQQPQQQQLQQPQQLQQAHHTQKSEPTLEKPLAEKLTDHIN